MIRRSGRLLLLGAAVLLCVPALAPAARAEDFLSALFGAFGGGQHHTPSTPLSFVGEGEANAPALCRRPGLLRADLRRTLFPDHGDQQ